MNPTNREPPPPCSVGRAPRRSTAKTDPRPKDVCASRNIPPRASMLQKPATIMTIAILLSIAASTHARVFTRWGGNNDAIGNLTRLGGKIAYTTNVKINDGQGKLTVIGFDDSINTTESQILRILNIPYSPLINHFTRSNAKLWAGQPLIINRPPSTSLHIIHGKTTTLRLILLKLPQARRLLAITIEQPNIEFKKSQSPPSKHQLKTIPTYPGSTPTFYAESSQTKLSISIISSSDNTEAIHNFYHSMLQSNGWQPYLSNSQGSIPQMTIYQRNNELCYILATPSKTCNSIILLHKQLTI